MGKRKILGSLPEMELTFGDDFGNISVTRSMGVDSASNSFEHRSWDYDLCADERFYEGTLVFVFGRTIFNFTEGVCSTFLWFYLGVFVRGGIEDAEKHESWSSRWRSETAQNGQSERPIMCEFLMFLRVFASVSAEMRII